MLHDIILYLYFIPMIIVIVGGFSTSLYQIYKGYQTHKFPISWDFYVTIIVSLVPIFNVYVLCALLYDKFSRGKNAYIR